MNKANVKKIIFDILIKYQGLLLILIAIDQITKVIALNYLKEPVYVFGLEWFQLKLQINSGVAFSMFKDAPQWVSALISVVAACALEYYIIAKKPKGTFYNILLIALVAGALGNGIDRWLSVFGKYTGYSGVVDFIFPTFFANFNVADIYVTVSCFTMVIYLIFTNDDEKKVKTDTANEKIINVEEKSNE